MGGTVRNQTVLPPPPFKNSQGTKCTQHGPRAAASSSSERVCCNFAISPFGLPPTLSTHVDDLFRKGTEIGSSTLFLPW
ncbi:hypothetical protein P167DRAFT_536004 [Morchella conica CCBAS932]|uniref:Uncharacterized protein n=1 Tax=Morchella conica CCBAS932 TaxID=1392247 RepID=A0A3N4KRU9_9PEZI|nr:hypothetical protein P167DRAFT_536004 [Morchella conica CCBAS932]